MKSNSTDQVKYAVLRAAQEGKLAALKVCDISNISLIQCFSKCEHLGSLERNLKSLRRKNY